MTTLRLYAYGAALLVLAGLLLAGGWWAYSKGEAHQGAKDQALITQAMENRAAAIAQVDESAAALKQVNATAHIEQMKAAIQQGRVEAAVELIQKQAAQAKQDAASWQARYQAALATPACHAAQEELCPALSNY